MIEAFIIYKNSYNSFKNVTKICDWKHSNLHVMKSFFVCVCVKTCKNTKNKYEKGIFNSMFYLPIYHNNIHCQYYINGRAIVCSTPCCFL